MPFILETERLALRAWTSADALALFEICRDPEVMLHIGTREPYRSVEDARRFLVWAEGYQREHGFCRWAVVEKASGALIGSCGFMLIESLGEIELGYLFGRKAWRRGYATEAAGAALRYGFERLQFSHIIALTDPDHTASQRVLEKLGFISQGIREVDGDADMFYLAVNPEKPEGDIKYERSRVTGKNRPQS
jgi:ribosomal-protein-alanine N-acetyltransferase